MLPKLTKVSAVLAMAAAVGWAASTARADYSNDFETFSTAGFTLTGTAGISGTHAIGNADLTVPSGSTALINIPGLSSGGVLTVAVFDQGNYTDKLKTSTGAYDGVSYDNGFRVGITPSLDGTTAPATTAMILVDQRTYVSGNYYSYSVGDSSALGGFYSPYYTGDLRTDLSTTPNNGSYAADGGQWTYWEYDFDSAGNVSYFETDAGGTQIGTTLKSTLGAAANSFFVYGGSVDNGGVYIDNINFKQTVPEPASLSLLGLAAGGLFMRRRRRHA